MLLIVHLLFAALFVVLGLAFRKGKGIFLIAGYNTASAEEKAKIDEKKLCKYMSQLMFALAGCWLVVACSEIFHKMALLWVGLGLFCIVCVGGVLYMNTGNRLTK